MTQMFFYFKEGVENLLFKGWTTDSLGGFIGSCIGVGAMAMLLEFLTLLYTYWHRQMSLNPLNYGSGDREASNRMPRQLRSLLIPPSVEAFKRRRLKYHVLQTINHIIHLSVAYFVMLVVMTYNAWLGISVIIGAGLGYYLFGAIRFTIQLQERDDIPSCINGDQSTTVSSLPDEPIMS